MRARFVLIVLLLFLVPVNSVILFSWLRTLLLGPNKIESTNKIKLIECKGFGVAIDRLLSHYLNPNDHYKTNVPVFLRESFATLEQSANVDDFFLDMHNVDDNDMQSVLKLLKENGRLQIDCKTACTLIKQFLGLLPEPLIPPRYFKINADHKIADWIRIIKQLRFDWPKNYAVYDFIFHSMHKMANGEQRVAKIFSDRIGLDFVKGDEGDLQYFSETFAAIILEYSHISEAVLKEKMGINFNGNRL